MTQEELRLRPAYRVGELLESVPGLVVTLHSGEGKAPQYLARGFNLDHGTDIANFVDDMPVNRPTNAHGQGYADLNFIIPETLAGLEYTKGTYYPSIGDFGDVASVHLHLADEIRNQIQVSGDTFGGYEAFVAGTHKLGVEDRLTAAIDASVVNGPYDPPDEFHKYAAELRYSHGAPDDGYDFTVLYYHGDGKFTTDQPARALTEGLITRYGTLDPSDGNRSERLSVSGHYATEGDGWKFASNAYYVRSRQTLFNNFTHFLEDPANGDQEQQDETRDLAGGGGAFKLMSKFAGIDSETTLGFQGRYDGIYVDRRHTVQRRVLPYCELLNADGSVTEYSVGQPVCTANLVKLYDVGLYGENNTRWAPWLRTDVGVREEFYGGRDLSLLPGTVFSTAPYTQNLTLFQPKGGIVFGPFAKTELYLSAGRGFHSDDIRGVSGTVPLEGIPGQASRTPFLVKADSEEVGIRTDVIPKVNIQVAYFYLRLQSELVYDQDQGEDQPGPPSERNGVEFSAEYRPVGWLELNTDLSFAHARYVTVSAADLLNNFGDDGRYIPIAPHFIGSVGALVDNLGPWFGSAQVRILGSYPLVSDNSETDAGYTEVNLSAGYKFSSRLKAQVEVFNALDVKANAAAFYYTTVIPDGRGPVSDHQYHPLEPISARLTMTAYF